jgi:hypothetical protein
VQDVCWRAFPNVINDCSDVKSNRITSANGRLTE